MSQVELHKIFEIYGPISSLKISRNSDHTSKGYAYIQFQNVESAQEAIAKGAHIGSDKLVAMSYKKEPKQAPDQGNNLYVKHIPDSWNQKRLEKEFSQFGSIKSCKLEANQHGKYAFVCFDDPVNPEEGGKAAQKAIEQLDGKQYDEDPSKKLYVRYHLNKSKHEQ